jgi:hypothetical protein
MLAISTREGCLCGTARQGHEIVPFLDFKVNSAHLTWNQDVTRPMRLNVKFDVTLAGEAMTGTAKAGMFPAAKVSGERAA